MKLSESWLKEWVNPNLETAALAEQLTMAGLEVDAIEPAAGEFTGVCVGRVESTKPHPDANKLTLCEVDVGQSELLDIVCGAANTRPILGISSPRTTNGIVTVAFDRNTTAISGGTCCWRLRWHSCCRKRGWRSCCRQRSRTICGIMSW